MKCNKCNFEMKREYVKENNYIFKCPKCLYELGGNNNGETKDQNKETAEAK